MFHTGTVLLEMSKQQTIDKCLSSFEVTVEYWFFEFPFSSANACFLISTGASLFM